MRLEIFDRNCPWFGRDFDWISLP